MAESKLTHSLFRILFSGIFLVAGFGHIFSTHKVAIRLAELPAAPFLNLIAPIEIHVILAGVALLIGGTGLLLGFWTRLSALLLFSVLVPITLSVQLQGAETMGPLFKNIALLGGLLFFARHGTSGYSLDEFLGQKKGLTLPLTAAKLATIAALVVFASPTLPPHGLAQAKSEKGLSVALLVRTPQHLKVGMQTLIEGIESSDEDQIKSASLIFCGKQVDVLKKDSALKSEILSASEKGVDIIACGLSLKKMNIKQEELLTQVRVVPNGLKEMIRLKAQGHIGVDL